MVQTFQHFGVTNETIADIQITSQKSLSSTIRYVVLFFSFFSDPDKKREDSNRQFSGHVSVSKSGPDLYQDHISGIVLCLCVVLVLTQLGFAFADRNLQNKLETCPYAG